MPRDAVVLLAAVPVVLRAAVLSRACSPYRVVRVPVRAELFDVHTYKGDAHF